MQGIIILGLGIGMIVLAGIFFAGSIVYRNTEGKKVLEVLKEEYGDE